MVEGAAAERVAHPRHWSIAWGKEREEGQRRREERKPFEREGGEIEKLRKKNPQTQIHNLASLQQKEKQRGRR